MPGSVLLHDNTVPGISDLMVVAFSFFAGGGVLISSWLSKVFLRDTAVVYRALKPA